MASKLANTGVYATSIKTQQSGEGIKSIRPSCKKWEQKWLEVIFSFVFLWNSFVSINKWWLNHMEALKILKLVWVAAHIYTQPWTNYQNPIQHFVKLMKFMTGYCWVLYKSLPWSVCVWLCDDAFKPSWEFSNFNLMTIGVLAPCVCTGLTR